MRKKSLAEMARIGKNENFSLPHNIKSHKQLLSNGKHCYIFKHDELGELGRILIVPHGQNSQICCEVAGDHDDPMTNKRREVFEPIVKEVSRIMSLSCGESGDTPKAYVSPKERHLVKSMVYPCQSCNAATAMLVFAEEADTQGHLEDFARLMHSKAKELDIPTWIVGKETENIVNGEDLRKSLVLKIYPNREEAKITTPDDLMDTIDELIETHCLKAVKGHDL